jgi:hypothetical protein
MGIPISYLRDDFEDNSIAPVWAVSVTGSATATETGGQARFTLPSSTAGSHDARLSSTHAYDLTGDGFFVTIGTMVATGVAATAFFALSAGGGNLLQWVQASGTLKAQTVVGGSATDRYSVTWNATTYKYLRIRESGGNVLFDSSSDGTSWTNRASVAAPFAVTDLSVVVGAACGNVASPGSFRLDDVNLILPALSTNWHMTQVEWPELHRFRTITLAATSGQGYIATSNDGTTWQYFSGPMGSTSGGYNQLTLAASQAQAQAMAVNLPLSDRWDLPSLVECRFIKLFHRSITGSAYFLREFYPRRLLQADDMEAECIVTRLLGAGQVTADKIFVLELAALAADMGTLHMTGFIDIDLTGGIFQGTGTAASPTNALKMFNVGGVGKLSSYNGTIEQVTIDTDGKLKWGGGAGFMDADGIEIVGPTFSWNLTNGSPITLPRENMLQWSKTSGSQAASIVGSASSQLLMLADQITLAVPLTSTVSAGMNINDTAVTIQNVNFSVSGDNLGSADFEVTTAFSAISSTTAVRGALNVGTATGASGGEIRASDKLRLNGVTDASMQMKSVTIANNTTNQLGNSATESGFALIYDSTGGYAIYVLHGASHATAEWFDPNGVYSITSGTASSSNIYWSAGNNRYEIENKRGASVTYKVYLFVG